MANNQPDKTVDLLVVGSGAAGFSAAVTAAHSGLDVLLIEKSELLGGTSATSGGGVWIPCSPVAAEAGHPDREEDAFQYLRALTDDNITDERICAYIRGAPAMLNWMAEHTDLRFVSAPYPDYHPEAPGCAETGWRTHFPTSFDGRRLGRDVELIRRTSPAASFLGLINWTLEETHVLLHRPKGWMWVFIKMLWRYFGDVPQRLRSSRDRFLSLGNGIIGSLKFAADRLGVTIWRQAALIDLIREDDTITGAVVEHGGRRLTIGVSRGVVLASGGFERNAAMRQQYLPAPASDPAMSGAQENNTGDAISVAQRVGAAVLNMDSAWWAPVFKVPGEDRGRLCSFERAFPGCIMVNQAGERYMNEAASYHVAAQKMIAADRPEARTAPSWILFDSRFRRHYPMGPLLPIPLWLHSSAVRSTVFHAKTWKQLAAKTGLPPATLEKTVERFNAGAIEGVDHDFQRGASEYDRYYGDPKVSPNPTLAPLAKPPFFAMQLHLGDIGTNGGITTNEHAQVLDENGNIIRGLYAAGNTSASVMGHSYPAAGGTLGPALTFGFIAGRHAAESEEQAQI